MTAKDPGVKYVEGVWTRFPGNELFPGLPVPHAWTTVDGHHVDLVAEFFGWCIPGDDVWGYEPLREYSYEELRMYLEDDPDCRIGFNISYLMHFLETAYDAYNNADEEDSIIFQPAVERLAARLAVKEETEVAA